MKQQYIGRNFRQDALEIIERVNEIIDEYLEQGYTLTVRQLYYQFVARGYIENSPRSYSKICSLVNDGRLAGLIDWDAIEDRTRDFVRRQRWQGPQEILDTVASSYHEDLWVGQKARVVVIVEKEALVGVLENVCYTYDVPLLAARGYPSASVLREFARSDIYKYANKSQNPNGESQGTIILHLGDHDPSGIDMSRDLDERLYLFCGNVRILKLNRLALNMDQVEELKPPENPAKITDARFTSYARKYGNKSWELDALPPTYLNELVERNIKNYIDSKKQWEQRRSRIVTVKDKLKKISKTLKGF